MNMRIQKYLSQKGVLSRREAEKYLQKGLIKVNGKVVTELGTKIDPEKDTVDVTNNNSLIPQKESVLVNKPRGVVVSNQNTEGETIFEIFPQYSHLSAVGRLDKESDGLLILSNDGVIAKKVTGPDHTIEKEYVVTVREDITPAIVKRLESGIKIDKEMTLPAKVQKKDRHTFSIILVEGKKHQIRRMCDAVRLTVESLTRIRIGNITDKKLRLGKSRPLTTDEIDSLKV